MGEQLYYLLSVKWTNSSGTLTWWAPDGRGYVDMLKRAGKYTAAEARSKMDPRWVAGEGPPPVVAVPCEAVEEAAVMLVPLCNATRPWMRGEGAGVFAAPQGLNPSGQRNGGVLCDVEEGPCACGAWHKPKPPTSVQPDPKESDR